MVFMPVFVLFIIIMFIEHIRELVSFIVCFIWIWILTHILVALRFAESIKFAKEMEKELLDLEFQLESLSLNEVP